MNLGGLVSFAALVITIATAAYSVLRIRPLASRARFIGRIKSIEFEVVDAVLDGVIDRNDPAYLEFIRFNRALSEHPEWFSLTNGAAMVRAYRERGIDPKVVSPRASHAGLSPRGRRLLMHAEHLTQAALSDYLVTSSRFWFALAPGRWMARKVVAVRRLRERRKESPTPWEVAVGYRDASTAGDPEFIGSTPTISGPILVGV